jgi:D-3-phosphoglycerate dehydrogenase
MSDYLLTGAVTNALNMPSITAEEAPRLKPFAALAEKLGAFAGQIVDEGLEEVAIEYEGEVTKLNMKPLTAAALAGLLRPLLQDVNMVSAPALLKERGTRLTESTRDASPTYESLIRVKVKTGGGWRTLAGALMAGKPRLVEIKGMALEAPFNALMLYINNADKPGFIGALGTLMGDAGVNIATFHLGRDAVGGEAIALVGIDQPPAEAVMATLKALPQVRYAKLLRF